MRRSAGSRLRTPISPGRWITAIRYWKLEEPSDSYSRTIWVLQKLHDFSGLQKAPDHSGHAALGGPFNPAESLHPLAHGQAHGGPSQEDRGHGSDAQQKVVTDELGYFVRAESSSRTIRILFGSVRDPPYALSFLQLSALFPKTSSSKP